MIWKQVDTYTAVFRDISQPPIRFDTKDYFTKLKTVFQPLCHKILFITQNRRVKYEDVFQLKEIKSGIPQDNIIDLVFYLLYIADLLVSLGSIADDAAIFVAYNNHIEASFRLQENLSFIKK